VSKLESNFVMNGMWTTTNGTFSNFDILLTGNGNWRFQDNSNLFLRGNSNMSGIIYLYTGSKISVDDITADFLFGNIIGDRNSLITGSSGSFRANSVSVARVEDYFVGTVEIGDIHVQIYDGICCAARTFQTVVANQFFFYPGIFQVIIGKAQIQKFSLTNGNNITFQNPSNIQNFIFDGGSISVTSTNFLPINPR